MTGNILLFPALLLEATAIKVMAEVQGQRVIAAASDPAETGLTLFAEKRALPYVYQPDFPAALRSLLAQDAISHIYSPHHRCHAAIQQLISEWGLSISLSNGLQHYDAVSVQELLIQQLLPIYAAYGSVAMRRSPLSPEQLAGFLRLVARIPGQSHFEKLAVLGVLAADCPVGDCVEIGVASGRSTASIAMLCQYFRLGVLLAVDPLVQAVFPAIAVDPLARGEAVPPANEQERSLCQFIHNLLPFSRHDIGFLHQSSETAAELYQRERVLGGAPLGPVTTTGKIALLHIDGDHSLQGAMTDLECWTPHLLPGALLLVDDYIWPYGDGPKVATDRWLEKNRARVAENFVAGRAMFIKMK